MASRGHSGVRETYVAAACRLAHVATPASRRYIWRRAREDDRWPTLSEWRFIIIGRWAGF